MVRHEVAVSRAAASIFLKKFEISFLSTGFFQFSALENRDGLIALRWIDCHEDVGIVVDTAATNDLVWLDDEGRLL